MRPPIGALLAALATAGAATFLLAGARADESTPPDAPPPPRLNPQAIWPAGLEKLAGRYVFAQVASPGGLWERAGGESRQVSISQLSAAMREKLTRAEIVISDLKLPTTVEAEERLSPSKRGILRFFSESAQGTLRMRNLPGIGGADGDAGTYSGPVEFMVEHQGHSNPSAAGVLLQRMNQEATWGAATLDYADLNAIALPAEAQPGTGAGAAAGKNSPRKARPEAGAGGKEEAPDKAGAGAMPDAEGRRHPDEGAEHVIGNARVLRSGVEIFAFVNWTEKGKRGRTYHGSVRLMRQDAPKPKPGEVAASWD